jgi:hypothetical protein
MTRWGRILAVRHLWRDKRQIRGFFPIRYAQGQNDNFEVQRLRMTTSKFKA